jgi:nucleotide-binding universal stress UspA family protein
MKFLSNELRAKSRGQTSGGTNKRGKPLRRRATAQRSRKRAFLDHVLVPVDFSECSQHALHYAEKIAGALGSMLTVLNVIPLNEGLLRLGAEQMQLLDEQLRENQRRKLLAFVKKLATVKPSECLVRLGHPVQQIIKTAAEVGADAIVISTHGLTGLKHALIGSTAEHVVRHARCSVLVVPAKGKL